MKIQKSVGHNCSLQELGKLVTCSSFSANDDSYESSDENEPSSIDEVKGSIEVKDAEVLGNEIADKYVATPPLKIKNFQTAAMVLTKGCSQVTN